MNIPFSRDNLHARLSRFRAQVRHAFAVPGAAKPLTFDDVRLLDGLAEAVVRRGMAAPMLLCLESLGPLNFLGSQALYALQPFVEMAVPAADVERLAKLLERRDTPARLAALIEARAQAAAAR